MVPETAGTRREILTKILSLMLSLFFQSVAR